MCEDRRHVIGVSFKNCSGARLVLEGATHERGGAGAGGEPTSAAGRSLRLTSSHVGLASAMAHAFGKSALPVLTFVVLIRQ